MNRLAAELVKGILSEAEVPRKEVVGMFGGGFKPPTVGHLEVVKRALDENPEMDRMVVLVGSGERDSITQDESLAIWRIYQKYLPKKVEVQPAPEGKAPIAAVYSYAKKNPDKDVYWFLGAREGNEEDSMDIIKRTKSLQSGNYPNVTVKKILTGGTVSGTKTRKALLARDKETFIQSFPDIPEVDQIWDMLSDTMGINEEKNPIQMGDKFFVKKGAFIYHEGKKKRLKRGKYFTIKEINDNQYSLTDKQNRQFWVGKHEMCNKWDNISLKERVSFNADFITKGDVEFVDDMADRKLAPVDVDLSGGHFFDRLNDPRNFPDISIDELEEFFDKLADEKEAFIEFLRKYKDVVVKDTESNLNIPFMKKANKAIAKTIMRKKNFKTPNVVLPLDEGRYDFEVTAISRMIINFFKDEDVFGKKVSETFEDAGELDGEPYDLELYLIPSDFDTLGPTPFIINAAGDEDAIAIQIDYQPDQFPEAYNELIPELKDAIRHELEHTGQGRFNKGVSPDGIDQDDLDLVDYLTLDYEVPAFVQGIYKQSKTRRIPFSQALQNFLDERADELTPDEEAKVKKVYLAYAKKNLPSAQINEADPLKEVGEGSSQPFPYEEDAFPLEYIKDYGIGRIQYTVKAEAKGEPIDIFVSGNFKRRRSKIKGGEKEYGLLDFRFGPKFGTNKTPTINDKTYMFRLIATLLEILKEINSKIKISFIGYEAEPRRHKLYTLIIKKAFPNATVTRSKRGSITQWDLYESKDPKKGTGKKPKGSGRRLYTDEDPSDTVKIKFSTRQDIVDTLNKTSFKNKSHARQSQVINLIHQRVRAAYNRAKKPEVKKRLKTALDYITQRKEASKKKTQRLKKQKTNEGLIKENLTPQIASLTQYMDNNGLNLRPYPKVKFIDNDSDNANDLLGRTAYYDPNQQLVALYTMGRHPKDILRSYAHELIHHHQNLSGTLNHAPTTNTNEDGALEKIEREAYEEGNILFRNWEDSIKNEE